MGQKSPNRNRQMNLLTLSTKNAILYNEKNQVVASITDGVLNSEEKNIYMLQDISIGKAEKNISLYLPVDTYIIENKDNNNCNFTVNVVEVNQGATITTDAKKITFTVDDQKRVNRILSDVTEGQEYHIILESSFVEDKKAIEVRGKGTSLGQAGMCQSSGKINLIGGNITNINVDGEEKNIYEFLAEPDYGGDILLQKEETKK